MVAILTLTLALAAGRPPDIAVNDEVRGVFESLLEEGYSGMSDFEQGAFVIRMPTGHLAFFRWPSSGKGNRLQWAGALPPNAIAIVHTHPVSLPQPSYTDTLTSRKYGLPVYVITLHRITRVADGAVATVARGWRGALK
jgi:hypothetical protein